MLMCVRDIIVICIFATGNWPEGGEENIFPVRAKADAAWME